MYFSTSSCLLAGWHGMVLFLLSPSWQVSLMQRAVFITWCHSPHHCMWCDGPWLPVLTGCRLNSDNKIKWLAIEMSLFLIHTARFIWSVDVVDNSSTFFFLLLFRQIIYDITCVCHSRGYIFMGTFVFCSKLLKRDSRLSLTSGIYWTYCEFKNPLFWW